MITIFLKMATLRNLIRCPYRLNYNVHVSNGSPKNISVFSPYRTAYDADGKTVVSVMNSEENAPLMINAYSKLGFRLNNGCFVIGPIAIFPQSLLSWNIKNDYDIHEKSLSLFLNLYPKLDVLLIGLSDAKNNKLISETRKNMMDMLKHLKQGERMNIEVLPTEKAVTTFNFLNSEKRFVAAALLPPTNYSSTLDDEFRMDYLNRKKDQIELLTLK